MLDMAVLFHYGALNNYASGIFRMCPRSVFVKSFDITILHFTEIYIKLHPIIMITVCRQIMIFHNIKLFDA